MAESLIIEMELETKSFDSKMASSDKLLKEYEKVSKAQASLRQSRQLREERQQTKMRADEVKAAKRTQQELEKQERIKKRIADKDKRNSFGARAGRALASTRFNASNGDIMPLAGSLATLFGAELEMPVLAAASAITLLATAAASATHAMLDFRAAQYAGYASAKETGAASGIGLPLHKSVGDVANDAKRFADTLAHDPTAAGFGASIGLHDFGTFDTSSKTEKLQKAVDALRKMPLKQAEMYADKFGLNDYLPLREVSDKQYEELKKQGIDRAGQFSDKNVRQAAFHNAQAASWMQGIQDFVNRGWNSATTVVDPKHPFSGEQQVGDDKAPAIDAQTKATQDNTQAIDGLNHTLKQGVFGGGERAAGALPKAYFGNPLLREQAFSEGMAMRLGAFRL